MAELLFETLPFSVYHEPCYQWLEVRWYGHQASTFSLADAALLLRLVRVTQVTKLLCTSTASPAGWRLIRQWLSTNYLSELYTAGIRAIAWTYTSPVVARTPRNEQLVQAAHQPLVVLFQDSAAAFTWLRTA